MKKWMTALALVMAFSLAGCGSQVNDDLNRTGTDQNDQVSNSTAAGDAYYEADRAGEVEPDGTYNDQTATNGESGMAQGTKNVVDGAADAVEDVTDGIVNGTERVVDGVINGVDNAADTVRNGVNDMTNGTGTTQNGVNRAAKVTGPAQNGMNQTVNGTGR